MNKLELFKAGVDRMGTFCKLNDIPIPQVMMYESGDWMIPGHCAFYRSGVVHICLTRCAAIGVAGPAWSYPGYIVDRTPYGVLQHELGHHVDVLRSQFIMKYMGNFSLEMSKETSEAAITSYAPNHGEWFAEMFRLFVTNPHLLELMRPKTYAAIREYFKPVEVRPYWSVLNDAPERTKAACEKRILKGI